MKTAELTGAALDWAVAKCELLNGADYTLAVDKDIDGTLRVNFGGIYPDYSTEWCHGGAIIERELIDTLTVEGGTDGWQANKYLPDEKVTAYGTTPLIAAMRCYVASKLGDEVEVPKELMTNA